MARTKQQLIDKINNSSLVQAVVSATLVNTDGTLKTYDYQCLIGDDNEAVSSTITFYVNEEGTENEEAWFKRGLEEVITTPAPTFKSEVESVADDAVANDMAVSYKITSVDEVYKTAEVEAYTESNGDVTSVQYLAYNDKNDTIRFKQLV